MAVNPSESNPPAKASGLWARLCSALTGADKPASAEVLPTFDVPAVESVPSPPPLPPSSSPALEELPVATALLDEMADLPIAEAEPITSASDADDDLVEMTEVAPVVESAPPPEFCPACSSRRIMQSQFCFDCGFMYPLPGSATAATPSPPPSLPGKRLDGRYEITGTIGEREGIHRFQAIDHGEGGTGKPVVLARQPHVEPPSRKSPFELDAELDLEFGQASTIDHVPIGELNGDIDGLNPDWPGLGWEWRLLNRIDHPAWPKVVQHFVEDECDYLVEATKPGRAFWDAWDDPASDRTTQFNWLAEIAEATKALHDAGAILEGVRPDILSVAEDNRIAFFNLRDLLPLPLPPNAALQATLYTAPELILESDTADARAGLYSFGAMLYSLYLGRELTEMDFERQGVPKTFVLRFPDVHPALARIVMKTFVRELDQRFPSEEAVKEDPSGFTELARVLRIAGRLMSQVRLDAAGWTTTGMIRSNNEDAFALLQSVGSKQDDLGERVLAILADGMGGYEAGEIAAAMAIDSIRQQLLKESICAGLVSEPARIEPGLDVEACRELFLNVLKETNRAVFQASRTPGVGKRGMGCTAELAFVAGRKLIVGHVGDSRTYHFTGGRLIQISKDQTLVSRLVELGQLTEEEAENHPRKNELQQAVGGQPMVDPLVYDAEIVPGDWIIVCSDGLTGHVNHATLAEMIQRADSAEMLARRLCNLANLYGGTDNCTVIAIRAT